MNKKKILSLIMALVMLVGVFSPLTALAAGDVNTEAGTTAKAGTSVAGKSKTEQKIDVTLHKVKLTSLSKVPTQKEKENFIEGLAGNPKEKYVGGEIDNIKDFFDDQKAEEIAGVKFTYWVFNDEAKYEEMIKNSSEFATVAKVDAHLNGVANLEKKEITSVKGGKTLDKITVPANENRFIWVVETSSVFQGEDGKDQTITGMKAVPFGLALPLFKEDGTVNTDIHVYPKNTTANEPEVDKDFKGNANAKQDREEADNNIVKDVTVGEEVPYDIETIIPAGAKYKTAVWTDQMTEGLTFNQNSVKVYIGAKNNETEFPTENYTVTPEGNGFTLKLTDKGLAAINGKNEEVRLRVEYSATVNEKAKVEIPERNDVIFHYGNDSKHGNTPEPNKPNDSGNFTVTKKWATGTTLPTDGIDVTFTLYNANTGKAVTVTDLVEPTEKSEKAAFNTYKESFKNPVTKKATTTGDITFEWKYLDKNYQYVAKETFNGYAATYTKGAAGEVTVNNEKTDNPGPKDPQEPGVKTYGHRFQKVDQEGTGLPNAKFVVINKNEGEDKDKVLAKKDTATTEIEQAAYVKAEKEYKDAVKAGKTDAEIASLKETRDKAYIAVNTQWEWIAKAGDKYTGAYVFESSTDGYFKVTGLAKGSYELVETEAPDGYAKLTAPVPFTVGEGSTGVTELNGEKLEDKNGFTQVENKKVTIPQTGGMGTVLFTVVGISLMAGAVVAMKRNREEA
ncbi:isopeptide-forming domain-containing fimbrial protein [Peptoniphilus harei]|uniref:isopeptide-forming domain-containing fimbrial protein n=1 Tax=Peptoniphilus harei TaxID=54005 RepID=UPI0028FFF81D|nr:isopeptide-forming domain-containing fimbrial protein [Peptoniphilus harei]MDU1641892.1 isopeptide-forming domain-containing fimbrial protein [Peptoniphilus harei]